MSATMQRLVVCSLAFLSVSWGTHSMSSLVISVAEAIRPSIRYGDILEISNLKTQQNKSLQHIAECMNNSVGIVMNPPTRTRRNRKEVRLEWIGDKSIKAGIKLKYLQKAVPSIYIHFFEQEHDWSYIDEIMGALMNQNRGNNVILNQITALNNYNIGSDDLACPSCIVLFSVNGGDWNNTTEIISFLKHEFNQLSSVMFAEVSGKLISCKKIHKIRKKVMPLLTLSYREWTSITRNQSMPFNKAMQSIQAMLNDSNTKKDYQAFFSEMKKVIQSVVMDRLRVFLRISDAKQTVKLPKIRASDLMKAYRKITMEDSNGDVHVLCRNNGYWDFPPIHEKLLSILNRASFDNSVASEIAQSIIKMVHHPICSNCSSVDQQF